MRPFWERVSRPTPNKIEQVFDLRSKCRVGSLDRRGSTTNNGNTSQTLGDFVVPDQCAQPTAQKIALWGGP